MKLYLAGPDVFAPDAERRFDAMRRACREAGFTPLTPADTSAPDGLVGRELAAWIKETNRLLVEAAGAVVANITPFRGPNMDPGTAWEIGYAEAKGLPVYLWTEQSESLESRTPGANGRDPHGWMIESFGLAENLMIAVNRAPVAASFEQALRNVARSVARPALRIAENVT